MSLPKSNESKNFLNYANNSKSNYYSNNSNSTSGSFETNNKESNTKQTDSKTSNKKKYSKICKHDYNFLPEFYREKRKNKHKNNNEEIKKYEKAFRKISFCVKCRGLIVKLDKKISKKKLLTVSHLNSETIKSYNNPIEMFFLMQRNDANKGLIYINNYSKKRRDMISFLAKLRNKYKLSLDAYYLAIALLDNVCAKIVKFTLDIELLTIGCFFLAGKFIENDAYLGEFELLSNNFKKIFYSAEEMQKSEIYCLNLLSFNLSIPTAKQYYDIFCFIGFVFKDELNSIKDLDEFYESGNLILKALISDFQSTNFSNLSLAFSVVRYLREFHSLEIKKQRQHILESIYKIKPNLYHHSWELLKKIKNFKSTVNNDLNDIGGKRLEETKIKLKLNNEILVKSIDNNNNNNNNINYAINIIPVSESIKSNGNLRKLSTERKSLNKNNNYVNNIIEYNELRKSSFDKIYNNSKIKENEEIKNLENPNSIQFKTKILSNKSASNLSNIPNLGNRSSRNNDVNNNNNNYNNNDLNTIDIGTFELKSSNDNKINNSDLPTIRSASCTKEIVNNRYSSDNCRKEFQLDYNDKSNKILIENKANVKDSDTIANSLSTVEAMVNKLHSSNNSFRKSKPKFASSNEIKVYNFINANTNANNFNTSQIKKIIFKNNDNHINENLNYCKDINVNDQIEILKKEDKKITENLSSDLISKINQQQLKSSTTKKLISINPISTFNASSSSASIKSFNAGFNVDERKSSSFKKHPNFLANSKNSVKVLINANSAYAASLELNKVNLDKNTSLNVNREHADAPLRRSSKIISENEESAFNSEFKIRLSKRLSHQNLPKANFPGVEDGFIKTKNLKFDFGNFKEKENCAVNKLNQESIYFNVDSHVPKLCLKSDFKAGI